MAASPYAGEVAALASLARSCRQLQLPGPSMAAQARMRSRFWASVEEDGSRFGLAWPWGRRIGHRLAAGALAVSLLGGGASYATGYSPAAALDGTASALLSLARNLTPRESGAPLFLQTDADQLDEPPAQVSGDAQDLEQRAEDAPSSGSAAPGETPPSPQLAAAPAGTNPTPAATATPSPTRTPTPQTAAAPKPQSGTGAPPATPPPAPPKDASSATATPAAAASSTPSPTASPTASPTHTPTPEPGEDEDEDEHEAEHEGEDDKDGEGHEDEKSEEDHADEDGEDPEGEEDQEPEAPEDGR